MKQSGSTRPRRQVIWAAVVIALSAGLMPASAAPNAPATAPVAQQARATATKLSGYATSKASVRVGGALWDSVTVLPQESRPVIVQYRRTGATAYTSVPAGTTSASGAIDLHLMPPSAGTWQFRVLVPATALATRLVSSPRTVRAAGTATRTSIRGFDTTSASISRGGTVTDDVVVSPRTRRVVMVQARPPGSAGFVTQSTGGTTRRGRFNAVYLPTSAGVWQFRLAVRADASHRAATSAPRLVTAVDPSTPSPPGALGPVTALTSTVTLDSATLSWVNPTVTDFAGVTIRRAAGPTAPAGPTAGTRVASTGRATTTFTDAGLTDDTQYSYALFARDGSGNVAPAAQVTVRTARRPVTGLEVMSITRTTVNLAWTNPTDDPFAGAVIRRAVGAVAPVSVTDGDAVSDVPAPGSTFTDTGLTPGTQYTYAVFAHDAAEHVAAPATLTLTTRADGTNAVLAVNPLEATGARITVDTPVAFDASQSLAADGTDLVSWSIDYGDGTAPETFVGPFGPADIFNTTHTFSNNGDRTVTLTVTDSDGGTDTVATVVHVFDAPRVTINATTSSPQVGVPVIFEVHAETPANTAITSWEMAFSGDESFFLDGQSAPPTILDVTFILPGTYTVVFSLTNDAGGTAVAEQLVVVGGP